MIVVFTVHCPFDLERMDYDRSELVSWKDG